MRKYSPAFRTCPAIVTAHLHHGSLLDGETGLQLKGARWYSPDLGRFISEDPVQDGSIWRLAFGNNPVMYADPTGLYQAGHPLQGGSGAGPIRRPNCSTRYPSD